MTYIDSLISECRERLDDRAAILVIAIALTMEQRPADPMPVHNLALLLRRLGHMDLWRRAVDVALRMPHVTYEQLRRRAHARLTLGDWSGWADREGRLFDPRSGYYQSDYVRQVRWSKRAWDGREDLRDKTLFILADGGFGDCLQMWRFVPSIAAAAGHVILSTWPELVSLARHNFGTDVTVALRDIDHALPYQRYAWIMSLPTLVGRLPAFVPLTTPAPSVSYGFADRLRIGLCWAGDPGHPMDRERSLSVDTFGPLLARDDVQWYSLQVGPSASEATAWPRLSQSPEALLTFADTADFIAGLDCVVTVDTAVAHLAGSLGIPTIVLLNFVSEFRWGLDDTTPWYPTAQLLRQPAPGDWSSVIKRLSAMLDARADAAVA